MLTCFILKFDLKFQELAQLVKKHKIKGFCDVLVTENVNEGISCLVQVTLRSFRFRFKG